MSALDTVVYYIVNVLTFGATWVARIIITKAIIEAKKH